MVLAPSFIFFSSTEAYTNRQDDKDLSLSLSFCRE